MAHKSLPSPDVLRQLLKYDPDTGRLFWRRRGVEWFRDGNQSAERSASIWNGKFAGKEAMTCVSDGYRTGNILSKMHRAHRVAFAMHYGSWPIDQIDHIDGNRANNRIENLRDVSNETNGRNAKRIATNMSGVTGVCWNKRDRRWLAYIRVHDVKHHLGEFQIFDDAVRARKAAEATYGFHPNHGRNV